MDGCFFGCLNFDVLIDCLCYCVVDWPFEWCLDCCVDWLFVWSSHCSVVVLICLFGWVLVWSFDGLIVRLFGWVVDRVCGWFSGVFNCLVELFECLIE